LRLLGFELTAAMFRLYAPPSRTAHGSSASPSGEGGLALVAITGGIYVVRPVKRVQAMRLVTPACRKERRGAGRSRR